MNAAEDGVRSVETDPMTTKLAFAGKPTQWVAYAGGLGYLSRIMNIKELAPLFARPRHRLETDAYSWETRSKQVEPDCQPAFSRFPCLVAIGFQPMASWGNNGNNYLNFINRSW